MIRILLRVNVILITIFLIYIVHGPYEELRQRFINILNINFLKMKTTLVCIDLQLYYSGVSLAARINIFNSRVDFAKRNDYLIYELSSPELNQKRVLIAEFELES